MKERMPKYHLYCIGDNDRIGERHDYDAADDRSALESAQPFCGKYKVDVWENERLVARLTSDGTARLQPESRPAAI
jgi:hypothetical protein